MPVAVRIGILYVLARAVTAVFFVLAAQLAPLGSRFGADPSPASFAAGWDAWWYGFVATYGYPDVLPLTDAGDVAENAWAFMPLYAYISSWVGIVLGSWIAGAVLVSMVAGYLACLVLHRMMRMRGDDAMATWAVVFFAAGPLAALFQVGYAESLFLLWLFLSLWCVMRRRYGWLYLLIPLMGLTRPGVLAFALFLGLHGIHRWFTRAREPLPARDVVHIVALGALATRHRIRVAGVRGTPDGGCRAPTCRPNSHGVETGSSIHPRQFVPFDGFLLGARFWAGQWGIPEAAGYALLGRPHRGAGSRC